MKYADLPKHRLNHLVKPTGATLEEWQVMLRMQQAQREELQVECVSERDHPGEYRVKSPRSGGVYKVVFRGAKSPWNYCDCMDFKTSQLGTCKHIEAARQWIADHHKRIHWDLPAYTSVYLSYRGNERQVKIRVGTTHESDFRALAARYFDELDTLTPRAYEHFGEFLTAAHALDEGFRCYQDALDFVLEQREAIARRKVVQERYDDAALDGLLHTTLYPYQKEGVCYEGGLDAYGEAADTRTNAQRKSLRTLLTKLHDEFPNAIILGHRDLSPDINGDGRITSNEWLKQCPCFDALLDYEDLQPEGLF